MPRTKLPPFRRHEKQNTPPSQDSRSSRTPQSMSNSDSVIVITISEQIFMSTDGANHSTSAVSHTVNHSIKPLPAMNTTSPPKLASKTATKSSTSAVELEAQQEKLPSSLAHTSPA